MNCRAAEQAMDRALDEALPGAQTEALQAHLARCPGCRRQWEALQMAEAVLRVPRPAPAPDDLLADFRRRLEAERPVVPRTPERPWLNWLWPAGSLAAAGLAAALAITFNLPNAFQIPETASTVTGRNNQDYAALPGAPTRESAVPKPGPKREPSTSEFALAPGNRGRTAPRLFAEKPLAEKPERAVSPMPTNPDVRRHTRFDESELAFETRLHDQTAPSALPKQTAPKSTPATGRGLASKQAIPGGDRFHFFDTLAQVDKAAKERAAPAPAAPVQPLASFRKPPFGGGAAGTPPVTSPVPGTRSDMDLYVGKKSDFVDRAATSGDRVVRLKEQTSNLGTASGGLAGGFAGGSRPLTVLSGADRTNHFYVDSEIREPRELDVSPAVLTALQRPVEVQLQGETLAGAVRQLTEAADVVLSYDPRVAGVAVNVTTPEPQVPLWVVLQEVAQQNNLQIVPRDNQLELRPVGPVPGKPLAEAPGPPALSGPITLGLQPPAARDAVPAPAPALSPAPAGAAGVQRYRQDQRSMLRAARPSAGDTRKPTPELKPERVVERRNKAEKTAPVGAKFGSRFEREKLADHPTAPDRRVWPELWGRLPEWGFALPTPEALPVAADAEKAKAAEEQLQRSPAPPPAKSKRAPRK